MRVERRDGSDERLVLTGMLVSRRVIGGVEARWEPGLLPSRVGSVVATWAVEHYRKYGAPAGRQIEGYFDRWQETADPETARAVSQFLGGLSDEYERLKKTTSPEYVLDAAARLFNRHKVAALRDGLESDLEVGDVEKAIERTEGFRKLELGTGSGITPGEDREAVRAALEEEASVSLVDYEDAAEAFFAGVLVRGAFIAFLAKEKGGKSFVQLDLAYRAARGGRNVAYFEVGDNTQHQVMRRLLARCSGRPVADDVRYYWPLEIEPPADKKGFAKVDSERRETHGRLTPAEGAAALERKLGNRFRLSCHPNSTVNVRGVEAILAEWERDGWVPDVIVVDYADILAPQDPRAERRDQINDTWKALRAMSQSRHALVVTATQANAKSYDTVLLRRSNFSEDKRKFAHVTGFMGINQTDVERKNGVFRFNWLFLRDLEFSEERCLHTAGCLAAACPVILSTF